MIFKYIQKTILKFWWIFLLAFIVYLSYGETLKMYFWVDDWGMAYKMQHLDANIPNFGPGIFGDGAYRYNVTPFIVLYPFFGLNAFPYFLLGISFYILTSLVVFLLVNELSGKKNIALVAAIIFACGYIGSDAMNHLNNSYQLVQTGALSALTSWLLLRYYRTNLKKYFFWAIFVYIAILEFLFLRSHGIFLVVLCTSILALVLYKKPLIKTLFKILPFFLIWFFMFFLDPRTSKEYDGLGRGDLLPNTFRLLIEERHFELFNNFLVTLSSVVFPDEVLFSVYRFLDISTDLKYLPLALPILGATVLIGILFYKASFKVVSVTFLTLSLFFVYLIWSASQVSSVWSADLSQLFISAIFGSFLVILGALFFLPDFRKRLYIVYFGLAWVVSSVLTYFIYTPTTNLASNTRYLIPAFIGTCILFAGISNLFSKKYLSLVIIPLLIYCSFLLSLTRERASYIVENISIPAREDLRIIKKSVPRMDENTVFYIEAANDSKFRKSELGGIPHLAIPVILNHEGIAKVALSYDEIFYLLRQNKAKPDNIYTFFGSGETITNTTQEFGNLLLAQGVGKSIPTWRLNTGNITKNCCNTKTVISTSEEGSIGVNPIFEVDVDYPSLVPVELTFSMRLSPIDNLKLPFRDRTKYYPQAVEEGTLAKEKIDPVNLVTIEELQRYITSEFERKKFYDEVSIKSNSSEKTREINRITDFKNFTSWEASSKEWRSGKKPIEINFKLNEPKTFSKFIWINYTPKDTPIEYTLSISEDGNFWHPIKNIHGSVRESGEIIVDSFDPVTAKYFKFGIYQTYGGNSSAPGITEAWLASTLPVTDTKKLEELSVCIVCFITTRSEVSNIVSQYKEIAKAKISWATNKNGYSLEEYREFPIFLDGNYHTYKIYIPAQGTRIKKIKLDGFIYPIDITINSANLKSMNLQEMINKKLIYEFAD